MKELEVAVFDGQLSNNKAIGVLKAASHSRQDLINMVKQIWLRLNHAAISQRGYEQAGPGLPLEGPIRTQDIGADLLPVYQALCPHDDPQPVGTQIRDEAYDLVEKHWGKQVHSWRDLHVILEEHVDHPAVEEGDEALNYHVVEHDDAADDAADVDDDADGNEEDKHIEDDGDATDDASDEDDDDVVDEPNESDGYGDQYDEVGGDDGDGGQEDIIGDPQGYEPTGPNDEAWDDMVDGFYPRAAYIQVVVGGGEPLLPTVRAPRAPFRPQPNLSQRQPQISQADLGC